ncbi:MAG: BatD family protein [bacterium]
MKRLFAGLFLVLALTQGGELSFTATVDRTTVGLNEPVQLTVRVTGTNIGRVPQPRLPELDGFENIGSSRSQSTSISIVNGRMTQEQTISFVYTLIPKKTGELVIGPCRLNYQGEEYSTEPITIKVTQPSGRSTPAQPQRSPFDIFEEPASGGGEVFLEATVDRQTVYQGEQVTATWTFYTSGEVADLNIKDPPPLTGFWTQEVYQPQKLEYKRTVYRGKPMYAAIVRSSALFPTRSGELQIGSMSLSGALVVPGFFFSTARPFEVRSQPLSVQVKPLPEAGKPACFSGGVGTFELSAKVKPETAKGGEPAILAVTVSGTGNLGLIGVPGLPEITGLKVLTPETRDNLNFSRGKLSGSRRFEFPLIPLSDGRFRIPEIEIGFFDPKSGSYYTKKTPVLDFVAIGVPARNGAVEISGPGMKVLGSDIRHIKTDLRLAQRSLLSSRLSAIFYILGLVVVGTGFIVGSRRRKRLKDPGYARRSGARKLVNRRLKEAENLLKENRISEFYALMSQSLLSYVSDRFGVETSALTGGELKQELNRKGVADAVVEDLLSTVNQCHIARFSPGMVECNPKEIFQRARAILNKI